MNLPNKLTIARIALIPVLVILMYVEGPVAQYAAAAVFALASFTDFLDGHIARSQGIVTDLGKFLDPIADKLLVLSCYIMLVWQGLLPAFVVILILARELCVDGLRLIAVTKGKVIAAGKLGKLKTVSQIVLALWLLLLRRPIGGDVIGYILLGWVVIITLWSGVDYFVKNGSVLVDEKQG